MTEHNHAYPTGPQALVVARKSGTSGPWCIAEIGLADGDVGITVRCSRVYGHVGHHLVNLDGERLAATLEWVDTWDTYNRSGGRVT